MPYISTERVAEIRKELKAKFPNVKFSVRKQHWSTVAVSIMESPYTWPEGTQGLNHFYLDRYDHSEFLQAVHDIMNAGNRIVSEDGDYGSIPAFYTSLEIGQWNRPHVTRATEATNGKR